MRRQGIAEALRDGIAEEMARDERVFCIGEDIGVPGGWGGAFTVTLGLSLRDCVTDSIAGTAERVREKTAELHARFFDYVPRKHCTHQ